MVRTSLSTAGVVGSVPGQGAKIPNALQLEKNKKQKQKIKQKQCCNKVNKDFFKKMVHIKKKKPFKNDSICIKRKNKNRIRVVLFGGFAVEWSVPQGNRNW